MTRKQAKNAVRKVREAAKKHFDKSVFCSEHNMPLQRQYHVDIEKELNMLAIDLEIILQTGYVSHNG